MHRSFTFLLRPTTRQAAALAACLEDHRQLYNAALEQRRTACARAGVSVRHGDQSAELREIRRADPDGHLADQHHLAASAERLAAAQRNLAHKAESTGRELIAVNPARTSRTCARCGHCAWESRLTRAAFRCTACGHVAHADVNTTRNILGAGLALRQAAEAVQREAALFRERRSHQGVTDVVVGGGTPDVGQLGAGAGHAHTEPGRRRDQGHGHHGGDRCRAPVAPEHARPHR
nr:transposase [Nonomuraea longispora]